MGVIQLQLKSHKKKTEKEKDSTNHPLTSINESFLTVIFQDIILRGMLIVMKTINIYVDLQYVSSNV